jgi:polyketide synthase PksN
VKSNIGHLESAAGIAAVTKAVLQLKHGMLVPSLHANPLNPNIDFERSPFYVQTKLAEWKHEAGRPWRVGVSSFGAGGANGHLVLEEYAYVPKETRVPARPHALLLSARDEHALCRYADRVIRFLQNSPGISLASLAYTSQVGRTPMQVRLVVIASRLDELERKLREWEVRQRNSTSGSVKDLPGIEDVFYSGDIDDEHSADDLISGKAGRAFLDALVAGQELEKLGRLWTMGVDIDWAALYGGANPGKISFPTYPFAKERCWISEEAPVVHTPARINESKGRPLRRTEEKQAIQYGCEWRVEEIAGLEKPRMSVGSILVIDTSDALCQKLRERLSGGSGESRLILAKPLEQFKTIAPDTFGIDLDREESYRELLETLSRRGCFPDVVVHNNSELCDLESHEQITAHLNSGVYALLNLCRALIRSEDRKPVKFVSIFSSQPGKPDPVRSALGGFYRSLTLENPKYLAKVIHVEGGPGENPGEAVTRRAELILSELWDGDWTATKEVRYRLGEAGDSESLVRHVSVLLPQKLDGRIRELPLRKNGVYLVTGGLGGLGLIFSEYLAREYQSKLILVGRSAPDARKQERLLELRRYGAEVVTLQADVSELREMERVVAEARLRYQGINGVIHAAGTTRDAFILRKTKQQMQEVLASKVYGAINVDLATREEQLDFFVLFSSIAGTLGNIGQSDYAYGNRFLDEFAEYRDMLRKAQKRYGRALSIDWPLWAQGGMGIDADDAKTLEAQTGICLMPAEIGIRYWEDLLRSELTRGCVLYGYPGRITSYLANAASRRNEEVTVGRSEGVGSSALLEKTEAYLKELIGAQIKLAPERIGSSDRLESFGIDSVMINRMNVILEKDFSALPKTLLYEQGTVRNAAKFLMREVPKALTARFEIAVSSADPVADCRVEEEAPLHDLAEAEENNQEDEFIAIVGMNGTFPQSADLDEYWKNLKNARDLIAVIPHERWSWEERYDPDPAAASAGKIYCKWGGFVDDYDKFDPGFFKIRQEEAKLMDPQERLFLESVWATIEDAGYTRERLKEAYPKGESADVGVFVGVTTNSYQLWASRNGNGGNCACPSAMPWSIANRVSYFFDFSGPSMPIDTACSSSLVAVHLACESLKKKECRIAIAGGVNLYLHPAKYQSLCQRRMLSLNGECRSYGVGGDGFVPGEGVGTLLLKPLSNAVQDRDRIYGVISATSYEHSGRSHGYSAPNPNSQARLISRMLKQARIDPESISYVEGHGTGTALGDSIEVSALTKAFQAQTERKQFCAIGSVKANIGHSESAAGIAGMAKVILQLKHRQLVPSIHSKEANPNIEFKDSPFYLQHELSEWKTSDSQPRRALINSFGVGGVNACVVVQEYEAPVASEPMNAPGPFVLPLSARSEDRLQDHVDRLLIFLEEQPYVDLSNVCYTLQVGREEMEERLAVVVSTIDEAAERLTRWRKSGSASDVYRGSLKARRKDRTAPRIAETKDKEAMHELAAAWVAGQSVDWECLHRDSVPQRISLPTYPFARERYWVSDSDTAVAEKDDSALCSPVHPLVHFNSSTLKEARFGSLLSDRAFYAVDHKVNGEKIFPGAGLLEIACVAGRIAGEEKIRGLRDIVWIHPVWFRNGTETLQTAVKQAGQMIEYATWSMDDENKRIDHSEGKLVIGCGPGNETVGQGSLSVQMLREQCERHHDGGSCYEQFRKHGLDYGPAFQTIQEIHLGDTYALSRLKVPDHMKDTFCHYILHPSLIDGAFQTISGIIQQHRPGVPWLPFALDELEIIRPLRQSCYAFVERCRGGEGNHACVDNFNILLLNDNGEALIKMKNLLFRAAGSDTNRQPELAAAV